MSPWSGSKETIVLDVLGYEKSDKNIRNSTNHTANWNDTRTDVSATLAVSRKVWLHGRNEVIDHVDSLLKLSL